MAIVPPSNSSFMVSMLLSIFAIHFSVWLVSDPLYVPHNSNHFDVQCVQCIYLLKIWNKMSLQIKVQYAAIFECIRRVTIQWTTISSYAQLQPHLPFPVWSPFTTELCNVCLPVLPTDPAFCHVRLSPRAPFVHLSILSYSYLSICTSLDQSTLSFIIKMVIYQPFSFFGTIKKSCCSPSDIHITSRSHTVTHVPIHITSLHPCAHRDHIQVSRSHPANLSQIVFSFPTFQAVTVAAVLSCPQKHLTSSCQFVCPILVNIYM